MLLALRSMGFAALNPSYGLGELYPDREIVQLDIDPIAAGGGGIHCVTLQLPAV